MGTATLVVDFGNFNFGFYGFDELFFAMAWRIVLI
jgi:hypothetical protein